MSELVDNIKTIIRAKEDFVFFCTEILGYKHDRETDFKDLAPVHYELCGFIADETNLNKLILNPRYSFKSQICTVGKSLYDLVRNPNTRILIYSDNATKAQGFLQDIKNHIEGNAPNSKFRDYFPGWETDPHNGKWNESQIVVSKRENAFKEPNIDTGGIETSKVGMHYDTIIFDDIVSDINVTTKAQMDKVYDCYKKSLSLLKPGGNIRIIGTRWHYGDAYGRIISENKDTNDFSAFIKSADELGADGKLLYESIGLDRNFLDYQKAKQGSYIYSCLYHNNPVSDETALFKIENFKYYEYYPKFEENMFITCTCDPAGEGEDFTAITVLGTDKSKNLYVLDAINAHLKPNKITDNIIRLNYKWRFDRFAIEKNFFKGMLEEDLRRAITEESKNKVFKPFSVTEITASAKNRTFARILALQPYQERGQIYLPGKDFNTLQRTYSELGYQMIQFTINGSMSPHDDLLCSLALHLDIVTEGGEVRKAEPPPTSAAAMELEHMKEMRRHRSRVPLKYRKNYIPVFNR